MQEFVTRAVSLRKFAQGDQDGRYILFTEHFGRLGAKAKSSRKIISKLAPHLEPGTVLKARFIEAHGTQVIDALKEGNTKLSLTDLQFLSILLPEGQPEPELWRMVERETFTWPEALALLGWDPAEARCSSCGAHAPTHFYISRQEFFCTACARKLPSKLRENALLFLHGV